MVAIKRQPPATGALTDTAVPAGHRNAWTGYLMAVAAVGLVTAVIALIPGASHVANISLLYLSGVIACALAFGRGPAVLASVLAVLVFDYGFVQPFHTLNVADPSEWLALLMFLLTAAVTGHLTAQLQARAEEARRREEEAIALKQVSWTIASQTRTGPALAAVLHPLIELAGATAAAVLVRDESGQVQRVAAAGADTIDPADPATDRAVGAVLDGSSAAPEAADAVLVPLQIEHRRLGVLALQGAPEPLPSANRRRLVETLANHAAVILERDRLMQTEMKAKALTEADRLKTALLSMVSHDFRSPLASIKASAASLDTAGPSLDAETRQGLLLGIACETDRLDRMVGNILALSRLDADAWRPQTETVPVAEVIEAGLAAFSAGENRRIRVDLADPWQEVRLDPVQIARVVHNLVENALKYAPSGEDVQVRVTGRDGDLVIEVLDRGPGVAPEDRSRIFERFYRAPNLHESAVPGLGIGLAICKGLVEAHGGSLSAVPREGGGACLRIVLPAAARQEAVA